MRRVIAYSHGITHDKTHQIKCGNIRVINAMKKK
jgi:hypothetical protein